MDYFVIWFVGLVCGFCLHALYEYSLSQKYMDKVNNVEPEHEPEIDDLTWFSEFIKTDEYAYFKLKALPERFVCCGVFFQNTYYLKLDYTVAFLVETGKDKFVKSAAKIPHCSPWIKTTYTYKVDPFLYSLLENNIEYIEWYK